MRAGFGLGTCRSRELSFDGSVEPMSARPRQVGLVWEGISAPGGSPQALLYGVHQLVHGERLPQQMHRLRLNSVFQDFALGESRHEENADTAETTE